MRFVQHLTVLFVLLLAFTISYPPISWANMALDKVIVDFDNKSPRRSDIEVTNSEKQAMYISVEASEILDAGLASEKRVKIKDPTELGLLVSPTRLVLEPGQTKTIRLSLLKHPSDSDRIYRVKIHPAVGRTVAIKSGLRIIVGYDVLVIARPQNGKVNVLAKRNGRELILENIGNTNVMLMNGRQCKEDGQCIELPPRRLYKGASWTQMLPLDQPAKYLLRSGAHSVEKEY